MGFTDLVVVACVQLWGQARDIKYLMFSTDSCGLNHSLAV